MKILRRNSVRIHYPLIYLQTRQLKFLDLCETRIEQQSFFNIANALGILRCLFISSVMLREEGLAGLLIGLSQIRDNVRTGLQATPLQNQRIFVNYNIVIPSLQGMECLDMSFNPLNQDIIARFIETALTKVRTVIFSREQIQSKAHQVNIVNTI